EQHVLVLVSEGSPGRVPEEPVGRLPPRPGPEHLLGFLWRVFMELKPDSWAPSGSKAPEFREGFEDELPLLPVAEGSVGGLPLTIAPGPSDCAPELTDKESSDSMLRGPSTRHGQPPDQMSSTLIGWPPRQPPGSRCCRRPLRSLCLCRPSSLHRRPPRTLCCGSWRPPELCACSGRPPGRPPELCFCFCYISRKHFQIMLKSCFMDHTQTLFSRSCHACLTSLLFIAY
ncbi:hypothetical protein CHARACLAT_030833, partial [Characodon lateralis]|nr:hypothetical protein [Characodon lateralis]